MNLHRFKKVYKPRNINVVFSQCGLQWHSRESHQKRLLRVLRCAVYPLQWKELILKMKALNVRMGTMTLTGRVDRI